MGYLSCKTHSSISISNSTSNSHPKKKKKKSSKQQQQQEQHHANPSPHIQHFHYRDLELATDHFSDHKLLGRGSHGLVYKALLPSGRLVAVKKPSLRRAPSS